MRSMDAKKKLIFFFARPVIYKYFVGIAPIALFFPTTSIIRKYEKRSSTLFNYQFICSMLHPAGVISTFISKNRSQTLISPKISFFAHSCQWKVMGRTAYLCPCVIFTLAHDPYKSPITDVIISRL